jgi:hypothetical protein
MQEDKAILKSALLRRVALQQSDFTILSRNSIAEMARDGIGYRSRPKHKPIGNYLIAANR